MNDLPFPRQRLQATVFGHVTGVNFRYYTRQTAQAYGLTGWVRNWPDDSVGVLAEGSEPALQRLLAWLHQGPPAAYVEHVEVSWLAATGEFSTFSILRP